MVVDIFLGNFVTESKLMWYQLEIRVHSKYKFLFSYRPFKWNEITWITYLYCCFSLDVVDLIHPYWKQFDIANSIPDSWHYAVALWMTFFGIMGVLGNLLVILTFLRSEQFIFRNNTKYISFSKNIENCGQIHVLFSSKILQFQILISCQKHGHLRQWETT